MLKVDCEGKLDVGGHKWQISQALSGERVQLLRREERMQVYYCRRSSGSSTSESSARRSSSAGFRTKLHTKNLKGCVETNWKACVETGQTGRNCGPPAVAAHSTGMFHPLVETLLPLRFHSTVQ